MGRLRASWASPTCLGGCCLRRRTTICSRLPRMAGADRGGSGEKKTHKHTQTRTILTHEGLVGSHAQALWAAFTWSGVEVRFLGGSARILEFLYIREGSASPRPHHSLSLLLSTPTHPSTHARTQQTNLLTHSKQPDTRK